MLRPAPEDGAPLVARRMVELEESAGQDHVRTRGLQLELHCTIIAADRVRRRDGKVDTLSSGRAILQAVQRAAADAGPEPTRFLLATGEAFTGAVGEYSPRLVRTWPTPAWDIAVTVRCPVPVD